MVPGRSKSSGSCAERCAAYNVAAAVLWRKPQSQLAGGVRETKCAARNFHVMMLAITGQWVAEVTVVLCLFGAACIGLAVTAGEGGTGGAPLPAEQTAKEPAAHREEHGPLA
jgi:hypothetical protein